MKDLLDDALFDIVERIKEEAAFLLNTRGIILYCNQKALRIFGYDSQQELEGNHLSILLPDDYALLYPNHIAEEHLTNGHYDERVSKNRNGDLIHTLVCAVQLIYDNVKYILVKTRVNTKLERSPGEFERQCLTQNVKLLKDELWKERNLRKKIEIHSLAHSNLNDMEGSNVELSSKLSDKFPNLSPKDLQLCSLVILNLSSKEMADKLGISVEGVFAARKRLRRKLGLLPDENLVAFINRLVLD